MRARLRDRVFPGAVARGEIVGVDVVAASLSERWPDRRRARAISSASRSVVGASRPS
jgi:hypothetical protein